MPVETIECQIVQAQLGRYLSGESFSSEMVAQLEAHIADCSICRAEVAHRRSSLQVLLGASGGTMRPTAPVNDSAHLIELLRNKASSTKTETPTHAVVEEMESPAVSSPKVPLTKSAMAKPLLYAGALAIVLIGMSYLSKGPTSLFGERALPAAATGVTAPNTTSSTTTIPAPATTDSATDAVIDDQPISEAEWTELGLSDWLAFDASEPVDRVAAYGAASTLQVPETETETDTDTDTPTTDETVADTTLTPDVDQPATLKDWELFGTTQILADTPAPATPIVRHPKARRPRRATHTSPAPRAHRPTPGGSIRVYDPN